MQEEKRFKIAETCGWKKEFVHGNGIDAEVWICPKTNKCWVAELAPLPDYFNDFNAIHEAEKILYSKGWDVADEYLKQLYKLVQDPHICQLSHAIDYVSSTATQRAEAFGKTLNLW